MNAVMSAATGRLKRLVTFEDVFGLALAFATAERFRGDSDEWHRVLHEVCQRYRDKIPELRVIFFEARPPLPPQTQQFYQLITTLSMGDLITLPNPHYASIVMDQRQKEHARRLLKERLSNYLLYVEEIAGVLDSQLADKS